MVWHATSHYLRERRIALRRRATPAEVKLWNCLHNKKLGVKFRRQHSIGRFILDFYCVKLKLGIELDCGIHTEPEVAQHDEERTILLRIEGITIIRFKNAEVINNVHAVVSMIRFQIQEMLRNG